MSENQVKVKSKGGSQGLAALLSQMRASSTVDDDDMITNVQRRPAEVTENTDKPKAPEVPASKPIASPVSVQPNSPVSVAPPPRPPPPAPVPSPAPVSAPESVSSPAPSPVTAPAPVPPPTISKETSPVKAPVPVPPKTFVPVQTEPKVSLPTPPSKLPGAAPSVPSKLPSSAPKPPSSLPTASTPEQLGNAETSKSFSKPSPPVQNKPKVVPKPATTSTQPTADITNGVKSASGSGGSSSNASIARVVPVVKQNSVSGIGAKAGALHTEASYVGDGDEVDEGEW